MAAFNGQWALKDVKDAAAYYDAINSPEEYKAKLRLVAEAVKADSRAYIEKVTVDPAAKTFHREVIIKGETKRDTGVQKFGEEALHAASDGRQAKVKVVLNSDNKITRTENGDGFSTETVFEVSGNTLTVTSTGNGKTTTSTYERV